MYVIDFAPSTHGSFLEYIINCYIFQIDIGDPFYFFKSGSSHSIDHNKIYKKNKIISRNHYTSLLNGIFPEDTQKVIFIQHDPDLALALLVNEFYRCNGGLGIGCDATSEEIADWHFKQLGISDQVGLRRNWFTKFSESHHVLSVGDECLFKNKENVFYFKYKSFFNISEFIKELRKVADFFNQTLKVDKSFIELYEQFIKNNQGFRKYLNVSKIIDDINLGKDTVIETDWMEQAWINYQLSLMYKIYDGRLFEDTDYPTNTLEIYQLLNNHQNNFDSRF